MNNCCNFYGKFFFAAFVLFLSLGSLQAQNQPNCDLSKSSSGERALCAKICSGASSATANLLNLFPTETVATKVNCNPANCKPSDCNKAGAANARLVSSEIKTAPKYSNSLESTVANTSNLGTKKCCASKCSKVKTSL